MNTLSRRELLRSLTLGFGATAFAPLVRAVTGDAPPDSGSQALALTAEQQLTLAALGERIIPTTDTPGAIGAGVPAFIAMMFADWFTDGERRHFLAGLDAFATDCKTTQGRPFPALEAAVQDQFLEERFDLTGLDERNGQPSFLEALRQLVIAGYYTSEVGMTVERRYIPTPGRYDGSYRYADVGTLFTY
jgi:hypothetical protein